MPTCHYEQKLKEVTRSALDGREVCQVMCGSMSAHIDLMPLARFKHLLDDKEYWRLLASDLDRHRKTHGRILRNGKSTFPAPIRPYRNYLMDWDEQLAHAIPGDTVTVYRGCQKGMNENGISLDSQAR
jgi:hypothetical protein